MNPDNLRPSLQQAQHNEDAGWTWCMLRPALVIALIEDSIRLEDAERRGAEIGALAAQATRALEDHHLGAVMDRLERIEELVSG